MARAYPALILAAVTPLLAVYGRFSWSWLAGPLAAAALYALGRKAREPGAPAPARERGSHRAPAPVD